jgi:hypothetical protein
MLARQLGIELPTAPPAIPSRIADWCVHSFRLGRHPWLVFCNTASLYPVFAGGGRVKDGESLVRRAGGMIGAVLQENDLKHQADIFTAALTDFQWAPIPGRSVLGSINELIYLAEPWFEDAGLTPAVLSKRLGNTPMSALGMSNPTRAFATLRT